MPGYEAPQRRFWRYVHKTETCWLWTGAKNNRGYGRFNSSRTNGRAGQQWYAHVWAWTQVNGPVPEGLTLHHRCGIVNCVNPDHLEPLTLQANASIGKPKVVASSPMGTLF